MLLMMEVASVGKLLPVYTEQQPIRQPSLTNFDVGVGSAFDVDFYIYGFHSGT
jgi:hypothetical protein